MSFTTDINELMVSDSSLNGLLDGGIHYENLRDNWLSDSINNEWIVYETNVSIQNDCIAEKNLFTEHLLRVVVIQRRSNDKIDIISERLITFLNGNSYGNIKDINFINNQGGFDQQKEIYLNTLEFNCIYTDS